MAIVELKAVEKFYKQGDIDVHALRGLDLTIEAGEFTAISGPSGSGKTTALNMIGALDRPTKGSVSVAGKKLSDMSSSQLAAMRLNDLGFVFQAYNLIPVLTAYENAEFTLLLQGMDPQTRRERVMDVLKEVGLGELADRRPDQLSGGQQQRVAIARAVAARPALVLADEPTANLDSKTSNALLDLMVELNREHGVTFLFSTHDQRVMDRARRVVTLTDGRVTDDMRRDGE